MSDTEPTLQELLKALQSTNASITSLNLSSKSGPLYDGIGISFV